MYITRSEEHLNFDGRGNDILVSESNWERTRIFKKSFRHRPHEPNGAVADV